MYHSPPARRGGRPTLALPVFRRRSRSTPDNATWRTRTHGWCEETDWNNKSITRSFETDNTRIATYLTPISSESVRKKPRPRLRSVYGHDCQNTTNTNEDKSQQPAEAPRKSEPRPGATAASAEPQKPTASSRPRPQQHHQSVADAAASLIHRCRNALAFDARIPTLRLPSPPPLSSLRVFDTCTNVRSQLSNAAATSSSSSSSKGGGCSGGHGSGGMCLHNASCFGRPRKLSQQSIEAILPQMQLVKCVVCSRLVSASCADDHSERCQSLANGGGAGCTGAGKGKAEGKDGSSACGGGGVEMEGADIICSVSPAQQGP